MFSSSTCIQQPKGALSVKLCFKVVLVVGALVCFVLYRCKTLLSVQNDTILEDIVRSLKLSPSLQQFLTKPALNPNNLEFLTNPVHVCGDLSMKLLFVIPSAPGNINRRRQLRRSVLADYTANPETKSKMLFFIGKSREDLVNENVEQESVETGDIALVNFLDQYRAMSLKMVSVLKWTSVNCGHVPYVIRNDDDVHMLDVESPVSVLTNIQHKNFILGYFIRSQNPKPHRNKDDKNYISEAEFPAQFFPLFTRGAFVGFPALTVKLLYEASLRTPAIWLDDVYITGICADLIETHKITHPSFIFAQRKDPPESEKCLQYAKHNGANGTSPIDS